MFRASDKKWTEMKTRLTFTYEPTDDEEQDLAVIRLTRALVELTNGTWYFEQLEESE